MSWAATWPSSGDDGGSGGGALAAVAGDRGKRRRVDGADDARGLGVSASGGGGINLGDDDDAEREDSQILAFLKPCPPLIFASSADTSFKKDSGNMPSIAM